MRRMIYFLLALTIAVSLAACGSKPAAQSIAGTPAEIIEKIYAQHKEIELPLDTRTLDFSDMGEVTMCTGLDSAEKLSEAAVSEPMMGQPYSLVVARVKNAADAKQIAQDMYDKIDTRKWICVMADTKTAAYCGDVVMFFMINSEFSDCATVESMTNAFQAVCGNTATQIG